MGEPRWAYPIWTVAVGTEVRQLLCLLCSGFARCGPGIACGGHRSRVRTKIESQGSEWDKLSVKGLYSVREGSVQDMHKLHVKVSMGYVKVAG